jgi:hypothetical protein
MAQDASLLKDSLRQSCFVDDFLKDWIGAQRIEYWRNFQHNDAIRPFLVRSPHLPSVIFHISQFFDQVPIMAAQSYTR